MSKFEDDLRAALAAGTARAVSPDLEVEEVELAPKIDYAKLIKESETMGLRPGECWTLAEAVLPHTRRMLLDGPPGTGKTHMALTHGLQEGEKVFETTLTPDTMRFDLIGGLVPQAGPHGPDFVWMDGAGIAAWRASHDGKVRWVINELNHASPEAISSLHVLLDDFTTASITLPNLSKEMVRPGAGLCIIATMNGRPEDLATSLADRFPVSIHCDTVHPGAVKRLSPDLRDLALNFPLHKDEERRISIRSLLEFDNLRKHVSEEIAAKTIAKDNFKALMDALKLARV